MKKIMVVLVAVFILLAGCSKGEMKDSIVPFSGDITKIEDFFEQNGYIMSFVPNTLNSSLRINSKGECLNFKSEVIACDFTSDYDNYNAISVSAEKNDGSAESFGLLIMNLFNRTEYSYDYHFRHDYDDFYYFMDNKKESIHRLIDLKLCEYYLDGSISDKPCSDKKNIEKSKTEFEKFLKEANITKEQLGAGLLWYAETYAMPYVNKSSGKIIYDLGYNTYINKMIDAGYKISISDNYVNLTNKLDKKYMSVELENNKLFMLYYFDELFDEYTFFWDLQSQGIYVSSDNGCLYNVLNVVAVNDSCDSDDLVEIVGVINSFSGELDNNNITITELLYAMREYYLVKK